MALGMSYDQYWYGDVRMTKAFVEADKLKQERMNTEKWLQGIYFLNALSCVLESNKTYPEKPYSIFSEKSDPEERQEPILSPEEAEAVKANLYMHQLKWATRGQNEK